MAERDSALDGLGLDDEEAEEEDLAVLKRVWRNEKCAPVLLPYEEDLVERVREFVEEQEKFLAEQGEEERDGTKAFMLSLMQLDLERVNFLIRSYLRTRLQKIQRLHQSLLVDSSMRQLMSRAEFRFCKGYADILGKHFNACVLQRLPESLRDMTKDNMISKPPLDNHVFVKVVEDLGEAIDIESEAVQMEKDETFVVRYRHIERLVTENKLELV